MPSPLLERSAEQNVLCAASDALLGSSSGSVVLVTGEAGIGKTSVVDRLLDDIAGKVRMKRVDSARVTRLSVGERAHRVGQPTGVRSLRSVYDGHGGLTNREIGGERYLSEKTVERHLSHLFLKLQVSNRAAVAATMSRADGQRV
jgi:DNA-binding CsgD family transcriptional regulator